MFLTIRGLALWVLIPLAFVAWLLAHSWAQGASLGQTVSWYDGTFSVLLLKGPLRPLIRPPAEVKFFGVSQMKDMPRFKVGGLTDLV